jgi:hypothetical protein
LRNVRVVALRDVWVVGLLLLGWLAINWGLLVGLLLLGWLAINWLLIVVHVCRLVET